MTCTGSTAPDEQGENQQPWKRCVVSPHHRTRRLHRTIRAPIPSSEGRRGLTP